MDERMKKVARTRREFLKQTLSAASFAGIAIVVSACGGGDDGGGGAGPGSCENPTNGNVSNDAGHSHSVRDLCTSDAGGGVNLTLSSSGGHSHTVTLTMSQVDQALSGATVSVGSSSDSGHTHTVSFN